jgi:hypothetical protein
VEHPPPEVTIDLAFQRLAQSHPDELAYLQDKKQAGKGENQPERRTRDRRVVHDAADEQPGRHAHRNLSRGCQGGGEDQTRRASAIDSRHRAGENAKPVQ